MTKRPGVLALRLAAACLSVGAVFACNAILGVKDDPTVGDASVPLGPNGSCQQDTDCPNIACYIGQCDANDHVCRYGLCRGRDDVCQHGTCSGGRCSESTIQYNYASSAIALNGVTLGCGGDPSVCTAAVYPFVIVGTTDGLRAVPVADITNSTPTELSIPLPFAPSYLVASPPNVYAVGALAGGKLAIASVEIPVDPTVTALTATATTLKYPFSQISVFPGPLGGLFLVDPDGGQQFPVAFVETPLPTGAPVMAPAIQEPPDGGTYDGGPQTVSVPGGGYAMYRSPGVPGNATIVGASGSRLVYASATVGQFGLLTAAGSPIAVAGSAGTNPSFPTAVLQGTGQYFSAPQGSLLWAYSSWGNDSNQINCGCGVYSNVNWIFRSGDENYLPYESFNAQTYGYDCPGDAGCSGNVPLPAAPLPYPFSVASLGAESALALVVSSGGGPPGVAGYLNGNQISGRPLGQDLDLAHDKVGFVGSNNLAFLVTESPSLSLTILDPTCP